MKSITTIKQQLKMIHYLLQMDVSGLEIIKLFFEQPMLRPIPIQAEQQASTNLPRQPQAPFGNSAFHHRYITHI